MFTALIVLHYIVCGILIITILLQAGKGADIGAVFGGGGSQTVFGGRGPATFLSKMTAAVAILFIVTSISMAHMTKQRETRSVFEKPENVMEEVEKTDGGIDTNAEKKPSSKGGPSPDKK